MIPCRQAAMRREQVAGLDAVQAAIADPPRCWIRRAKNQWVQWAWVLSFGLEKREWAGEQERAADRRLQLCVLIASPLCAAVLSSDRRAATAVNLSPLSASTASSPVVALHRRIATSI